ncbi:MAG: hypothetical protein WC455_09040 [Dehalococcoidia bacterium]|jgi:hypothetical protein
MKTIYADRDGPDYPSCPLRSDLNECGAEVSALNGVNVCPKLDDNGDFYHLPEWCPLRDGGVIVQFRPVEGEPS